MLQDDKFKKSTIAKVRSIFKTEVWNGAITKVRPKSGLAFEKVNMLLRLLAHHKHTLEDGARLNLKQLNVCLQKQPRFCGILKQKKRSCKTMCTI